MTVRSALVAGVLLLAGCGQPSAHPMPAVTASATPAAEDLAAWQQRGATEAPPASIRNVSLGSLQVVNQTGGAVSDADAARWALAYVRANAYEFWAWNHLQDGFLLRSGLSHLPARAFAYDVSSIGEARAAGVQLEVTRLVLRRLVLRPVPESLRQTITNQLYLYTPYALLLDQVGPSELNWIDRQGNRTNKLRTAAGVGAPELVGGQFATDPLMGDLWVVDSDWDCTAPNVLRAFGPLCSP